MRKWTGCGTTEDREAAERWWIRILRAVDDPECSVPRKVRVHAASCLAASQWEKRIVDDGDTWNVDCVSRAAFFANEAISYGFTSPSTLYVGAGIRRLLNTPRIPGVDYNRFDEFSFSFEAIAKRDEEVVEIASRREAKVSKAPNAYHCATPGCGIEATKKSGLLRCAGKCPAELKPSYCSKECQRAHWKDHRKVCNPDARAKEEQSRHPNHRPQLRVKSTLSNGQPQHFQVAR
ncbi:unnamed protein product [Somion occarium]|uniref:MYND-type domain-containing protein n=1 Tax=Somion occarium TaxID=3059160 RepID=A0ABP1CTP6_9APHY